MAKRLDLKDVNIYYASSTPSPMSGCRSPRGT